MKNVYKSEDWKKIDPLTRAEVLLVAEGLKPATTTGDLVSTYYPLLSCLKQLGLKHEEPIFRKGPYTKIPEYVITVYKGDKTIEELNRRLLDPSLNTKQVWRAYGEAYGYQDCCITRYSNAEIQAPNKKSIEHVVFDKELEDLKEAGKEYPDVLDYRVPSMTPCSVYCEKTLKLLGSWKEALEKHDPEAAEALKMFNKEGYYVRKPSGGLKWGKA